MSDTPLSDLISALRDDPDGHLRAELHAVFMASILGLEAEGMPSNRAPGETFEVGPGDQIRMKLVGTPDGRRMIKACADPRAFAARYPDAAITALMRGHHLLERMLKDPNLDGVLVCSAASFHSTPISRDDATRLLAPPEQTTPAPRRGWRWWSS
jgi:hypothetical protein